MLKAEFDLALRDRIPVLALMRTAIPPTAGSLQLRYGFGLSGAMGFNDHFDAFLSLNHKLEARRQAFTLRPELSVEGRLAAKP